MLYVSREALMIVGLVASIMIAFIVVLSQKKKTPPYLSPKYSNSEIPLSKIFPFLNLCNKLNEEDLKNERYKQRKL